MKCSLCEKEIPYSPKTDSNDSVRITCEECSAERPNTHQESLPQKTKSYCPNHQTVEASFQCVKCGVSVCKTCVFQQTDGTSLCPDCMAKLNKFRNSDENIPPAGPVIPEGTMCKNHHTVPAVQICQMCQTPLCKTCDFEFPDNIHVCPNCVNKPLTLSPKQKKNLIWSYVLASVATLGYFITSFSFWLFGPDVSKDIIGFIFLLFVLGPSITGLSFAINARPRNRKKPLSISIALIWNSLIIGIFLLLVIIGNFNNL